MKTIRYQGAENQPGYPTRKPSGGLFRIVGDIFNSQRLSAIQDEIKMDLARMQLGGAIFYGTPEGVDIVRKHKLLLNTGDNGNSEKYDSLTNPVVDDDLTV